MGQKVNPIGIRLGYSKAWRSVWYAERAVFPKYLMADFKIRKHILNRFAHAFVSRVEIQRPAQNAKITIHTARPGAVIGRKGEDVENVRQEVMKMMGLPLQIDIEEIKRPELDAQLVAHSIAQQLEKRVMFRRAVKRAAQLAFKAGAQGVKICVSGRIGGAEIARTEWHREGCVPLHTLRADIDYATSEAFTTYGVIGVKVWLCKGEKYSARPSSFAQRKENWVSSEDKRGAGQ